MPKKLTKPPLNTKSSSSRASLALPRCFTDNEPLPKLIIFDLDYTLWPFWVDTHPSPPFKPNADHTETTDRGGETYTFYPEVPAMLHALWGSSAASKTSSIRTPVLMGLASRTETPDRARDLLKQLYVYPSSSASSATDDTLDSGTPAGSTLSPSSSSGQVMGTVAGVGGSKKGSKRSYDLFGNRMEIYPGDKVRHLRSLQKTTKVSFEDILFFDDEMRNANVQDQLGVSFWHVPHGMSWAELERGIWDWRRRRHPLGGSGKTAHG